MKYRHRNRSGERPRYNIHVCTGRCVTEPPASAARLLAAVAAIAFAVPIIVIVLLAAATYLFGK